LPVTLLSHIGPVWTDGSGSFSGKGRSPDGTLTKGKRGRVVISKKRGGAATMSSMKNGQTGSER